MERMLWCSSVRLWKGNNKTRLFPFDFKAKRDGGGVISEINFRLTRRLSSGINVEVPSNSYIVNVNELSENGTLRFPKDDSSPALLKDEELFLIINTRFKEV